MVNSRNSKEISKSKRINSHHKGNGGAPYKNPVNNKAKSFVKSKGNNEHGANRSGRPYKKTTYGKAALEKSKEAQKHVFIKIN